MTFAFPCQHADPKIRVAAMLETHQRHLECSDPAVVSEIVTPASFIRARALLIFTIG